MRKPMIVLTALLLMLGGLFAAAPDAEAVNFPHYYKLHLTTVVSGGYTVASDVLLARTESCATHCTETWLAVDVDYNTSPRFSAHYVEWDFVYDDGATLTKWFQRGGDKNTKYDVPPTFTNWGPGAPSKSTTDVDHLFIGMRVWAENGFAQDLTATTLDCGSNANC